MFDYQIKPQSNYRCFGLIPNISSTGTRWNSSQISYSIDLY